jgi:hypothetical protein
MMTMIQGEYDRIKQMLDRGNGLNAFDAKNLLADNDDLADKLTDCWLLLDRVARSPSLHNTDAEELLRKQKAPGWKD